MQEPDFFINFEPISMLLGPDPYWECIGIANTDLDPRHPNQCGSGSRSTTLNKTVSFFSIKVLVKSSGQHNGTYIQGSRVSDPHSFFRIRIQRSRLGTNPDPDPDTIRIQGFNDQKLKKNCSRKKLNFFISKTAIYPSLGLHKVCPSYRRSLQLSKEGINPLKHELLQIFYYFCGSFLPSWIRIWIPNPDPDPLARLNTDPIRIRIRNPAYISIF
jgi:hypothetical protein